MKTTIYFPSPNKQRLQFVAEHLLCNLMGSEVVVTDDRDFFLHQSGICINYSPEKLGRGLHIVPHGLLSEKGVRKINDLQESTHETGFCFFCQAEGDLKFDLFAASFYLLTLYEEYFPNRLDAHGRFHHEASLLYRNGCLEAPIVDKWAYLLKDKLEEKNYDVSGFRMRPFSLICTYDIDFPFAYRNKGLIINAGGLVRDCLHRNRKKVQERIAVLFHRREDPFFEAIMQIEKMQQNLGLPYHLFVLVGGNSAFDNHAVYPPRRFYKYLQNCSATVGLHPSYETCFDAQRLAREKSKLENILNKPVTQSRQHFLRMQTPDTFRNLAAAGFTDDYTLAFAHAPGFRSGSAVPYRFYDVEKDETTALTLHPTAMMDSSFIFHLKSTPQEASQKTEQLINACRQTGGDFVGLWHNSNYSFFAHFSRFCAIF